MSNGLDPGPDLGPDCLQRLVWTQISPDLGPDCLQRLSVNDKSPLALLETYTYDNSAHQIDPHSRNGRHTGHSPRYISLLYDKAPLLLINNFT